MDIRPNTVVLVQIVMRHGERGPDTEENGQTNFNTLTERGRKQMQMLGTFVRHRYNRILNGEMKEIQAKSSRIPRCVDSAVQFIKGICPQLERTETLSDHVHTEPLVIDHMLYPLSYYPEAEEEVLRVAKGDQDFQKRHTEVISFLKQRSANCLMGLYFLRERVRYAQQCGLPLPENISEDMVQKVEQMVAEAPVVYNNSEKFKLIRASSLMKAVLDNMINRIQGNSNKRLHLFVTHDVQLMYLALALNIYDEVVPVFGESYIFELHHINSEYVVVISRQRPNLEKDDGSLVKVYPTDDKYCPLDVFNADFKAYFEYNLRDMDPEPTVGDENWHGRVPLWL